MSRPQQRPLSSRQRLAVWGFTLLALSCTFPQLPALELEFHVAAEAENLRFEWILAPEQRKALTLSQFGPKGALAGILQLGLCEASPL